jgi:hypothetical protein
MHLILYSKPGCHLCEGLAEKLSQVSAIAIELEIRDITTDPAWFERFQYEIPVLTVLDGDQEQSVPRFSPRASVKQVEQMLQKMRKT